MGSRYRHILASIMTMGSHIADELAMILHRAPDPIARSRSEISPPPWPFFVSLFLSCHTPRYNSLSPSFPSSFLCTQVVTFQTIAATIMSCNTTVASFTHPRPYLTPFAPWNGVTVPAGAANHMVVVSHLDLMIRAEHIIDVSLNRRCQAVSLTDTMACMTVMSVAYGPGYHD
ncbi:hypothetical protein EDB83DRAFT_1839697 [Lactarius deliciosus]|nr:hypothetical protein EDB83DRAFT_1839697 [Lactarius deliciosus]